MSRILIMSCVIMMENHGYLQILDNPNERYLNSLITNKKVNYAKNYFAIGHPSLTNYLEIVGGSNFGIRSDNAPAWGSTACSPNIVTGVVNADNGGGNAPVPIDTGNVCPIAGTGQDAETPAVDTWNEVTLPQFTYLADIDGVKSVPAATTEGKTIGDQLAEAGLSWKSYQESLPLGPVFGVNYSNGTASNLTDFTALAPLTSSSVVQAYAEKHNPFAYFQSVQDGTQPNNSLNNVVGFDGPHGLYADLATGQVPSLSFIVPSQCDDQHGRGNADAFCAFDPGPPGGGGVTYGTQVGVNPGLILQGDPRASGPGHPGLASLARQPQRDRHRLGRERLQRNLHYAQRPVPPAEPEQGCPHRSGRTTPRTAFRAETTTIASRC